MTILAEPFTTIIEERFNHYYFALKEVYLLHVENGFGVSPDIPSGFSEALCRQLRGLFECEGREVDAVCSKDRRYEIKATGTAAGKTTISKKAVFDVLLWLHIDFENDILWIYDIPFDVFELPGGDGRKSVTLSSYVERHNIGAESYQFTRPYGGFPTPA